MNDSRCYSDVFVIDIAEHGSVKAVRSRGSREIQGQVRALDMEAHMEKECGLFPLPCERCDVLVPRRHLPPPIGDGSSHLSKQ